MTDNPSRSNSFVPPWLFGLSFHTYQLGFLKFLDFIMRFGLFKSMVALSLLSTCLVGCGGGGPAVGRVTGTVTVDGKTASGVTVSFQPTDGGRSSSGVTDADGKYDLVYSPTTMGALLGKHNVSITAGEPGLDSGGGSAALTQNAAVPAEYAKIKKEVTVEKGKNAIDVSFP